MYLSLRTAYRHVHMYLIAKLMVKLDIWKAINIFITFAETNLKQCTNN